jgi:hypothetical protein
MPPELDRQKNFADAMAQISTLPPSERIDALLGFFRDVLNRMDSGTIRKLRDQVMARFSTCGCSFETCELVIEFINGHLALREARRHASGVN